MTQTLAANQWLVVHKKNPTAKLRLFCFPFVGGDARAFRTWADELPLTVEVCALNFPGRGTRFREPPFTQITPLVDALMPALNEKLDLPFAFFGHSVGALVSFEVARRLRRERNPLPRRLFVAARSSPLRPPSKGPSYNLPEPEFIARLRLLNGTSEELLSNPELMAILTPILRADFEIDDNYVYSSEPALQTSITAFGGLSDSFVTRDRLEEWRQETSVSFSLRMFPGGHFFTDSAHEQVLSAISTTLQESLKSFI